MRRAITAAVALAGLSTAAFIVPGLSQAADGTGVYGTWSLTDNTSGTVTFSGTAFPSATLTSTDENLTTAGAAVLGAGTPFGLSYGASTGQRYLSAGLLSGKATGSITLTFDTPPIPGTYGFALGDIDAENIRITAQDANGGPVSVSEWLGTTFNYAGGTDEPQWDATTGVLTGNGVDTEGASLFFTPGSEVKSITFEQVRTAGFPRFQLWIAADLITAAPVPEPVASASPTIPSAPAGKVVICHRTNSRNNPYVEITVNENSIDRKNGHDTHDGPIYPAANWGDIIPPFGTFPGQNWPEGAAILNNNCEVGGEQLITGASVSASPTSTASPTVTASASPTATPTVTASITGSPTATSTGAPTPTSSASATATPSGTAATGTASPTTSASPSGSVTPSTSATSATPEPSATSTIDPTDPTPIVVPADTPIEIFVPKDEITDTDPPTHGSVDLTPGGGIVYTPEPGYVGPVEIPVTVTDRQGGRTQTVITLNVGKAQTAKVAWPASMRVGQNVVVVARTNAGQVARVSVTCRPLTRMAKLGDVTLCDTVTTGGRTTVRVNAPATVVVSISAPAKGAYGPYDEVRTYTVR